MTFGSAHYVPALKIKNGEKLALQKLSDDVRARVTPLLEVVERKADKAATVAKHLNTTFDGFGDAVSPFARYLLDCREIKGDGPSAAADVFARAAALKKPFTPVTGLSRTVDITAALANRSNGVAIRLTRDEFEAGRVRRELPMFIQKHGLSHDAVDVIVDLGAVDKMVTQGIEAMTQQFLDEIPDRTRWRTLTVSGCAFPNSMGIVDRDSYEFIERADWLAWKGLHTNRGSLDRLPTFGDGAIQHPLGIEGFDFRIMKPSASIRIALPDHWLLIKGESTKNVRPKIQFPKLAVRLVHGHLSAYFAGQTHCVGCKGMQAAADGIGGFGSAGVWRRLGTIHHITIAVEQLAGLTWP